jgi:hypothetical protein
MPSELEDLLEAELARLGRRGGLDRGVGARFVSQRLRVDTFTATIEADASLEAVTSWVDAALGILGRPIDGPAHRAVIGAGFRNLNPAVVEAAVSELGPHRTRVVVRGVAKEGVLSQRTAAKAVGRVLDALGAGRRRKRRRRRAARPS